jgi:tetratricopeptide (TPR) repeat protein
MYLVKAFELEQLPEVQNLLGLCYFELKNYEQAKAIFENMLEKTPMNVNLLLNAAKSCEKLGKIDEALAYAEKITDTFPECEEAHELIRALS